MIKSFQTQIFIPPYHDYEYWYETLLGEMVKPLADKFEWFWFSQYVNTDFDKTVTDCTNHGCDYTLNNIPESFHSDLYRSVRLRFGVSEEEVNKIKDRLISLAGNHGYYIHAFQEWDCVLDLGSNRFCSNRRRAKKRSELVLDFYHAAARLVLDNLVKKNGVFKNEYNNYYDDIPEESKTLFFSLQHVFCNMTGLDSEVLVFKDREDGGYVLGSRFSQPIGCELELIRRHTVKF